MLRCAGSIALAALLASCFRTHSISVSAREIRRHQHELEHRGVALLEVKHARDPGSTTWTDQWVYADHKVLVAGRLHPVSAMFEDCPDPMPVERGPADPRCELTERPDARFELRRYDTFQPAATILAVGSLGLIGGAAYVGATSADSRDSAVERGVGVGLVTALGVGLVWLLVDCAGRWGQPGCRD